MNQLYFLQLQWNCTFLYKFWLSHFKYKVPSSRYQQIGCFWMAKFCLKIFIMMHKSFRNLSWILLGKLQREKKKWSHLVCKIYLKVIYFFPTYLAFLSRFFLLNNVILLLRGQVLLLQMRLQLFRIGFLPFFGENHLQLIFVKIYVCQSYAIS